MSKINIHRNTFLEKEELNRMIQFSAEADVIRAMLSLSTSFGLVSPGGVPGVPFTTEKSTTVGGVDIKGGYIITSDLKAFYVNDTINFSGVPADDQTYYLKAVCVEENFEPGYVQVDTNGNLSGTVNFANLVRGQSNVATAIRFIKDDGSEPLNNSVYQVVDIINDNNLVLSSGYPFQAEQQLRVVILGSVPMGRRFTDSQLQGLYSYNRVQFQVEKVSDFTSRAENEFYIGRVRRDLTGNVVTVLDERYDTNCPYWNGFGGGAVEVFSFTIVPLPSDAIVMMNGRQTSTISGAVGLNVEWSVSKPGFYPQSGSHTITNKNETFPVTLEENPNPDKYTIIVNTETGDTTKGSIGINDSAAGKASDTIEVIGGTTVNLYAKSIGNNMFLGWYDGEQLLSDANPFSYSVNKNVTITAKFDEYWDFEVVDNNGGTESFGVQPIDGGSTAEQFLVKVSSSNPIWGVQPSGAGVIQIVFNNGAWDVTIKENEGYQFVAAFSFATDSGPIVRHETKTFTVSEPLYSVQAEFKKI